MNREQLIEELSRLAKQANQHKDTRPAAAILFCICGSLTDHSDIDLMNYVAQFGRERIRALKAGQN